MFVHASKRFTPGQIAATVVLALVIVAVVSTIVISSYSDRLVEQVSTELGGQYAREINAQMAANINTMVLSFEDETRIIESALSRIDPLDEGTVSDFIRGIEEDRSQKIYVLATDGAMVDSAGRSLSTTAISFVGDLLTDGSYLSDNETANGESYVMYGSAFHSPLQGTDHEYWAVVVGITNENLSERLVLNSSYSNSYTSIIQQDGYYIVKNSAEQFSGRNLLTALEKSGAITENTAEEIRQCLKSRKSYMLRTMESGKEYFIYFAPMEDNSWVLVNHIPADFILAPSRTIRNGLRNVSTLALGILAAVAVGMLIMLLQALKRQQEAKDNLEVEMQKSEAANRAKTVFLNNMSHDIRTPMNAIMGLLTIAHRQNSNPEVENTLNKIGSSSNYLLSLINDVLDISRIESGKIVVNLKPVVLENISGDSIAIIQSTLSERNIDFVVERNEGSETYVMADKLRIQEILVNLMNNAVKFTDDGGRILFREEQYPDSNPERIRVIYTISDTGVGMSEEFMKHLFQEFEQEANDARTKYKGTGLGLAITKRLTELLGGTIQVESEKNRGTTFTVAFSIERTDVVPEETEAVKERSVPVEGLRVLLAEDNDLNAEIAEFILDDSKMTVTRAVDGAEALKIFEENPPGTFDVILMDVMMPNMNGYEATKAIRSLDNRPDARVIPIIAMTANAFAEDEQKALESGMNAHLAKPINAEKVIHMISRYVGQSRD